MQKQQKIGFIGAGNMAQAILKGMIHSGQYDPENIGIYDIDPNKCRQLSETLGIVPAVSSSKLVSWCDIIFLAVKPQNYKEVLKSIQNTTTKETVFVSIAAGISTSYVMQAVGIECPVIRVMPNTPLLLGQGATALARGTKVSAEIFSQVCSIFAASGEIAVLEEDKMNEVIAVNGSSPAYVYLFAKAMLDYAQEVGISPEAALTLVCKTLEGSAAMLRSSGSSPDELIQMVSSPGGTTLAALDSLKQHGFYDAIQAAMAACTKRAEELGQ